MCCGQCVRLLISMYSMSIFGPAAVTAARPGLETLASSDAVAHRATLSGKPKDPCTKFKATSLKVKGTGKGGDRKLRCECGFWGAEEYVPVPAKGCGSGDRIDTFFLADADPKTCRCITESEASLGGVADEAPWDGDEAHEAEDADTPDEICERAGGRRLHGDVCSCWAESAPSKECHAQENSDGYLIFQPDQNLEGCECKAAVEVSRDLSVFVKASALKFCSDILYKAADAKNKLEDLALRYDITHIPKNGLHRHSLPRYAWRTLTREEKHLLFESAAQNSRKYVKQELGLTENLCQEVLTGMSRNNQDWYSDATKLSKHKNAKGFGHLDPLVTGSGASHRLLLEKVCADECKDIVSTTIKNIHKMVSQDVVKKMMPFEQSCADRVVRKVEAEVLGCCGRACNWNGISCMAWPFFTEKEKVNWLDECCTEFNVLDGSSRDKMCDSVLSKKQVEKISKFNTKAKEDTDVGGAYIGQDPPLLWEDKGLEKYKEELKGLGPLPKEGDPVSSDFLEKHPDVRTEGLRHKWFKEEKMADDNGKSASFTQIGDTKCENTLKTLETKMQHCPKETLTQIRDTCFRQERGWQASAKPEPDDMDPDSSCQEKMIDPRINPPTEVGTPDECFEVKFTDVKDMKRKFFTYNTSDPPDGKFVLEKPILCFSEPEELRCLSEEEDFQGSSVRDIDFNPHKGFADYVYWINLD